MNRAQSYSCLCQTKRGLWKRERKEGGGGRRIFGQSHLFFHFSDERGVEWKDEAAARRVLRTGRSFITVHDGAAAACMVSVPACPDKRILQQVRLHLGRPCRQASGGDSPLLWIKKGGGFLSPPPSPSSAIAGYSRRPWG
jgi:hypothetical protein